MRFGSAIPIFILIATYSPAFFQAEPLQKYRMGLGQAIGSRDNYYCSIPKFLLSIVGTKPQFDVTRLTNVNLWVTILGFTKKKVDTNLTCFGHGKEVAEQTSWNFDRLDDPSRDLSNSYALRLTTGKEYLYRFGSRFHKSTAFLIRPSHRWSFLPVLPAR